MALLGAQGRGAELILLGFWGSLLNCSFFSSLGSHSHSLSILNSIKKNVCCLCEFIDFNQHVRRILCAIIPGLVREKHHQKY